MREIDDLAHFCSTHPIDEKILIGRSQLEARLIRDRLGRDGHAWIALRTSTVQEMALFFVEAELSIAKLRYQPAQPTLVERACLDALPRDGFYSALREDPGMQHAFGEALMDLEMAGIDMTTLNPAHLESKQRGEELRRVAARLVELRREYGLIGTAELLARATEAVTRIPENRRPRILLTNEVSSALRPIEQRFLTAVCRDEPIILEDEVAQLAPDSKFLSTVAPEHEFRNVLRDMMQRGIPCDDVEIVYTNGERYRRMLYELVIESDMPCTFAEGVHVQYFKAARTVLRYLEWLRDGEPYALIRMMYEGIPDFSAFSVEGVHANRLPTAALLREARIGRDPRQALQRVDAHIHRVAQLPDNPNITGMRACRELIASISGAIPPAGEDDSISLNELAHSSIFLLRDLCRPAFPGEQEAISALVQSLEQYIYGPDIRLSTTAATQRLLSMIHRLRMPIVIKEKGGIPRQTVSSIPGHMYISDLAHAAWSGRRHVYLIGMDDENMPEAHACNPVLLDHERASIAQAYSTILPLSGDHGKRRTDMLGFFLARVSGTLTVSFARSDETRLRHQTPSREFLNMYRRATEQHHADYTSMDSALGPPIGDLPDMQFATMSEWWLREVLRNPNGDAVSRLHQRYRMQARGREAEVARIGEKFSPYDGNIASVRELVDHHGTLSVSALEQLATCPYRYFLARLLRLAPTDTMREDASQWLTPGEFGSLVHLVLYRYMRDRSDVPDASDTQRMDEIIANALHETSLQHPPPSSAAEASVKRELQACCSMFLREERRETSRKPLAFELPFPQTQDLALQAPFTQLLAPLKIETASGVVELTGKIDRIDALGDGTIEIIDYKTGTDRTSSKKKIPIGSMLQPGVYIEAVRAMLVIPDTPVRFSWFFLSTREQGKRVVAQVDADELRNGIALLLDLRNNACFPHTTDKQDCSYCAYINVCGDPTRVTEQAKRKTKHLANTELTSWRRLHNEH